MENRGKKGQFKRTPQGQKTDKMLEVEERLGRTLEEDFQEFHIGKNWGQKRLANRWGVPRGLVFNENMRGGRRCWATMLRLPVRRISSEETVRSAKVGERCCELCLQRDVALDKTHWVSAKSGGSSHQYNILTVCPNCHRKLDTDNKTTIAKAREVLLLREVTKLVESRLSEYLKRRLLVELSNAIINRIALSTRWTNSYK